MGLEPEEQILLFLILHQSLCGGYDKKSRKCNLEAERGFWNTMCTRDSSGHTKLVGQSSKKPVKTFGQFHDIVLSILSTASMGNNCNGYIITPALVAYIFFPHIMKIK
jgi:hypothetical protein